MADALDTPALPCPECRLGGRGGRARIGNRRHHCQACNNFAQAVRRTAYRQLLANHAEEYKSLRLSIELELYPQVLERFLDKYPMAREAVTDGDD